MNDVFDAVVKTIVDQVAAKVLLVVEERMKRTDQAIEELRQMAENKVTNNLRSITTSKDSHPLPVYSETSGIHPERSK